MQKQNVKLNLYLTKDYSVGSTFYPIFTMYPLKHFYDLYMFAEYGSGSPVSMGTYIATGCCCWKCLEEDQLTFL